MVDFEQWKSQLRLSQMKLCVHKSEPSAACDVILGYLSYCPREHEFPSIGSSL